MYALTVVRRMNPATTKNDFSCFTCILISLEVPKIMMSKWLIAVFAYLLFRVIFPNGRIYGCMIRALDRLLTIAVWLVILWLFHSVVN